MPVSFPNGEQLAVESLSRLRENQGIREPQVAPTPEDGPSFTSVFGDMVQQANAADHAAGQRVDALASGASDDLHGTMIATKEAEISIRLIGSIRNKLLDAFHEIWRTSV